MDTETRSDLPASRAEAKRLGYRHYFTGKPCKNGHVDVRYSRNGGCLTCENERVKRSYWSNPEHVRDQKRQRRKIAPDEPPERVRRRANQWYWSNRERALETSRQYRLANPEYKRKVDRHYRLANLERLKKASRIRGQQWRQDNPVRAREHVVTRQATKLQRTPAWADREAICRVYDEAQRLMEETGVEHHVDHVYPLRGKTVSGLHVAENLEAVPARVNMGKSNAHPDEYYSGGRDGA